MPTALVVLIFLADDPLSTCFLKFEICCNQQFCKTYQRLAFN
jgi:hypothetical protein